MEKRANTNASKSPGSKETIAHKVGDKIERLGEKISKAGAQKLGKSVYNAGNKIEHMSDRKKRS